MPKRHAWSFITTPWDGVPGFWAWWNRLVYLWGGPAQLSAQDGTPPTPPTAAACPACAQPMALHDIRRQGPGRRSVLRCPQPSAA